MYPLPFLVLILEQLLNDDIIWIQHVTRAATSDRQVLRLIHSHGDQELELSFAVWDTETKRMAEEKERQEA